MTLVQLETAEAYEHGSLPTAGVVVKGCLDECDICEPEVHKRIELELQLLARQIELLDKAQEYRCCPAGSGSASNPDT